MKQKNNIQDKLKPCPFCGSKDVKIMGVCIDVDNIEYLEDINVETGIPCEWTDEQFYYHINELYGYAVVCDNCGCRIDSRTLRYDEERHKYLRLSVLKDAVNKWNTRADDEPYKKLFDLMVLYLALRDGVCSPIQTDMDNKGNVGASGCTKILPPNKLTDMLNVYMTGGCKE